MKTAGEESKWQEPMPVSRFVAPGPLVAIATPGMRGDAALRVGGERRRLLVADADELDAALAVDGVHHVDDHPADELVDAGDALLGEVLRDPVGDLQLAHARTAASTVSTM